ncbi:Phage regulatory protein Rha (Phage_pRha) [Caballeronia calidae]|uniref:Phage regulatory protein Rha (Phage_pRha) n=1 Tax=Caballeronia calidae TaxID=1777139 RepID=A0A158EGZ4_9BURK|nr:Rha family transcriptional regulator [Caballeronia calidae]SAL05980.1 Phage regulatory protein Rha (Phage_pRha) [Caballeronia calidae]
MIDLPALPDPLLTVREGEPRADSRVVAKLFDKRHDHVLRDIHELVKSAPELEPNFGESFEVYASGNGAKRNRPYFLMAEQGLMLLVMGFTGEKALAIKMRFVAAFKEMRDLLNAHRAAFAERMRDWELRERESAQRGTVGAKAICVRKREKPALECERHSILDAVQLTLKLTRA